MSVFSFVVVGKTRRVSREKLKQHCFTLVWHVMFVAYVALLALAWVPLPMQHSTYENHNKQYPHPIWCYIIYFKFLLKKSILKFIWFQLGQF